MSEETLVKYCSPTLAGLKTGSLFTCLFNHFYELNNEIKKLNTDLNSKGVYIYILSHRCNKALIYVCRPNKLIKDLSRDDAKEFLYENGYKCCDAENYIKSLSMRLCMSEEFPHEIGLFLGYPLNDVKGFIVNKGKNFKYTGYWKVYTDEYEAKKIFTKYKKCTEIYCKKLAEGFTLNRLTVAV